MCQITSFQVFAAHYFDLELELYNDASSWEIGDEVVITNTDFWPSKQDSWDETFTVKQVDENIFSLKTYWLRMDCRFKVNKYSARSAMCHPFVAKL